jgi:hypothetical protein
MRIRNTGFQALEPAETFEFEPSSSCERGPTAVYKCHVIDQTWNLKVFFFPCGHFLFMGFC